MAKSSTSVGARSPVVAIDTLILAGRRTIAQVALMKSGRRALPLWPGGRLEWAGGVLALSAAWLSAVPSR